MAEEFDSSFVIQCIGQVDGGTFDEFDYLYCRYCFTYGSDWEIVGGLDNGLSQTSCRNNLSTENSVTWNFPIDVSFKSTNIHGWPRVAFSVYGIDYLGRDVIRGYGTAVIPLQAGLHSLQVEMFKPLASSTLNGFTCWLMGNPPEFFDMRFVCQGEGREVSRVEASGSIAVSLQVVIKGLESFGYSI